MFLNFKGRLTPMILDGSKNTRNSIARVLAAVVCVFVLAAATLPQIDWNTQIKNKPTIPVIPPIPPFPPYDWLTQVTNKPVVDARQYNWAAQTPGGSLTASTPATVTLTPGPLGVSGSDTLARVYISAGTGTAESVALTGGTCNGTGQTSCTITFTPANSHSGAWTVQSSSAGIYEAIAANPGRDVRIPGGTYAMRDCITLDPTLSHSVTGDGSSVDGITAGTVLDFSAVSNGCSGAFTLTQGSQGSPVGHYFRDLYLKGGNSSGYATSGFVLNNVADVRLSNVVIEYFQSGITGNNMVRFTFDGMSQVNFSARYGILMTGYCNMFLMDNASLSGNSRLDGYANLIFLLTVNSQNVVVRNSDINGAGTVPFTTVTYALGAYFQNITNLQVSGIYFEANVGPQNILYQANVTSLTETGNWFNTMPVLYGGGVAGVRTFGNTWYGATALRSFPSAAWGTWDVGPDTCQNGSTECTTHPRLLSIPSGVLASAPAALTPGQPFYCTNCTVAATCTTGGTGHMATYNGSAWTCQ